MPDPLTHDGRHAIAERSVVAILDAAERLLERRKQTSISAVAAEAGLARVTVYAHFRGREEILEALVERAVGRAVKAYRTAELERGPALDALGRLIAASWKELSQNDAVARASAAELSADAMRRAHDAARAPVRRLVERGRREHTFRTDVAADWLVTTFFALVHAAGEEVRAGQLDGDHALDALSATIPDLFTSQSARPQHRPST
jgi:TetR/AcrR family transcriptional repressor of mexCD-oprJ operon